MIKIGIFEDHPIVLKSIIQTIKTQNNFELIFGAKTKNELFEQLSQNVELDVMIVDMLSSDVFGMEIYTYLNKNYPDINIIAFTSLSSVILVENLLSIGVKGYVNKNQEPEDLITAINHVHNGKLYLPNNYGFLAKGFIVNKQVILSAREVQITQLIAKEFTSSDIAKQLQISENTVENHRRNIFEKLGVKNAAGMVREAAKLGYL